MRHKDRLSMSLRCSYITAILIILGVMKENDYERVFDALNSYWRKRLNE